MKEKEVYQFAENGLFLGTTGAMESPREPGIFLMPSNTTDIQPPITNEGELVVWDFEKESWRVVPDSRVPKDLSSPLLTSEEGERVWRDGELRRADIELNKAQDGDGVGTIKTWREYRKALRAYPAVEGFPNVTLRPAAPDKE